MVWTNFVDELEKNKEQVSFNDVLNSKKPQEKNIACILMLPKWAMAFLFCSSPVTPLKCFS